MAKYFEPAGAVSWDVSMTATKPDWKVALKQGDRLERVDHLRHEQGVLVRVMGIMVTCVADGKRPKAKDPFKSKIDTRGLLTHGHLRENRNHGGKPRLSLRDARTLSNGPATDNVMIENFIYGVGDFSLPGKRGRPPVVKAGQSLTFTNLDATHGDRRPQLGLPHDHLVQGALHRHDRHRLSDRRRQGAVRLRRARLRPGRPSRRRRTATPGRRRRA